MLLVQPDATDAGRIRDRSGVAGQAQMYYGRVTGADPVTSCRPLAQDSEARQQAAGPPDTNEFSRYSRYDLAGTTIDGFREILRGAIAGGNAAWFNDGAGNLGYRRQGYPYPTKPLSSYGVARTTPWLVGGCTSFIVEYAGDYLNQLPPAQGGGDTYAADGSGDGNASTDGEVDYIVEPSGARRIRWYGMPRDVSNGRPATDPDRTPDGLIEAAWDVVPLAAIIPPIQAPHEHITPANAIDNTFAFTSIDAEYTAAWQPPGTYVDAGGVTRPDVPKPSMVRITMTIDDPSGRLPEGQTYEYVIELP
jgi:hypothetical protein